MHYKIHDKHDDHDGEFHIVKYDCNTLSGDLRAIKCANVFTCNAHTTLKSESIKVQVSTCPTYNDV